MATYDTPVGHTYYPKLFFAEVRKSGLKLADDSAASSSSYYDLESNSCTLDVNQLLIENPTAFMVAYQHAEGEDRHYVDHWTTLCFKATKPPRVTVNNPSFAS